MKIITSIALSGAALACAVPAFAHTGDHSTSVMTNIAHWVSSPSHALFAIVGGIAAVLLVKHFASKRA